MQLDALGFSWTPEQDQFEQYIALLRQFRGREGHTRVPHAHVEDSVKLGYWVASVRTRREAMSAAQVARLDCLEFVWSPRDEQFARYVELFTEFVAREGHAKVPSGHIEQGEALGRWAVRVRTKRATLPPDRIAELDALGFVWSVKPRNT